MLYYKTNKNALMSMVNILRNLGVYKQEAYNGLDFRYFLNNFMIYENFSNKYGAQIDQEILIVGSNPSQASKTNKPFEKETKSRQTIEKWFENIEENYLINFMNLSNNKTEANRPLSKTEIQFNSIESRIRGAHIQGTKIIGLGTTVHGFLDAIYVDHFKMWHPSGLCRLWNNKEAGEAKIKEMLEWIKN